LKKRTEITETEAKKSPSETAYAETLLNLWKIKLQKRKNDSIEYTYLHLDESFVYRDDVIYLI